MNRSRSTHLTLATLIAGLPRRVQRLLGHRSLTAEQLHRRRASGEKLLLVDVRTGVAEGEAIAGAVCLPVEEIMPRIHRLDGHRHGTLVLIGHDATECRAAFRLLRQIGFDQLELFFDDPASLTGWSGT